MPLSKICGKSAKIIQWGCRDGMHHAKKSRKSPSIKDTSTIMHNPSLHNSGKGVAHDCASILGFPCFHNFSHGAIYIPIQLNNFCTCKLIKLCVRFILKRLPYFSLPFPCPNFAGACMSWKSILGHIYY